MDLPSVLGGLAQGFTDFGKSVVDLFGTGGAAIGDLLQGTGTRNQDDFRKWLYNTNSVQDAAAKGLGTALNGVQTVSDYIPGIGAVTRNPLFNAAQGALGGLADEFKMAGENYDLGRAGQRAAVSGAAALAGSSLGDALKKSANPLLKSGLAQGLARGATGGAINQGGYAAIDGGDVWDSALQGAGMGALFGGATGLAQELRPHKLTPAEMAFTDEEKAARIANIDDQLSKLDTSTPDGNARYNELMQARNRYGQIKDLDGTAAVIAGKPRTWDELYGMLSNDAGAYENESRAPITATAKQLQDEIQAINAQYPDDMPDDVWSKRFDFNEQLKALESGYNTPYDYYVGESKRRFREDFESRPDRYKSKIADLEKQMQAQASLEQDIANASPRKLAQFEIIQKKNPAPNDTLTWIRSPKDIMTWDEAITAKQAGEDVGFSWPDYSFEDALRDQKRGKMTVYSSYPVKGGTFVTPSYQQASDYAGGGRVYSKVIKPEDVAWINGDEGQYAYTKVKSLESTLADADMAVNAAREPEGFTYDYDGSDMAAVQRAYNLATQDQARLDGMLKEISDTLGTEFSSAGQKSMKSMLDKVDRKVRAGRDYTVASMKDHTRGKVMMNSFNEIPRVLEELDRRGVPYETEVVTNDWGYKGYHITFRNPDGISSEIQLTTADHWPAKLESDAIYDKWRNFDFDASTKTERQRYNEAMAKSQALWAKVDFSEFDKTVQSLSDTGRALRSVAPVTSKLGLTQEPSLYTKMPSSSESANMSPSSVTRTFSGLGLDRSPNIDTPPFDNIIPQNTSRTLEGVLSADDLAVNSAKIAPGQLGLFDDLPTQMPKTTGRQVSIFDQPQEGLDYYGGDVEAPVMEPANPYAPVNGEVTQAMRDRANYIIDELALHKQIPENELFNKIDPKTLPKGHYETGKILDEAYSAGQDAKSLTYEAVNNVLKKELGDNPSKEKLISYLYDGMDEAEKKAAVDAEIGLYTEPEKLSELSLETIARRKVMQDIYGNNSTPLYSGNRTVRGGYTGALDSVLSERLGIAPGNTYKKIGQYDQPNGVAGRYSYSPSIASQENIMVGPTLNNEDAINTVAHERLHSFQGEAKELDDRFNRYDPEVRQAYSDLAQDLKKAKAYNTGKEVEKRYGRSVAYWRHHDEQEARMLQQYLDAKGYTASKHHNANQYLGLEFDDAKITPAFDKFFDKLRDLSKRGVALPALAALFGGGAYMASQNNDKEKEVK